MNISLDPKRIFQNIKTLIKQNLNEHIVDPLSDIIKIHVERKKEEWQQELRQNMLDTAHNLRRNIQAFEEWESEEDSKQQHNMLDEMHRLEKMATAFETLADSIKVKDYMDILISQERY